MSINIAELLNLLDSRYYTQIDLPSSCLFEVIESKSLQNVYNPPGGISAIHQH